MAKKGSGGLAGLSVVELQAELSRRQRAAGGLFRKRDRLLAKLREVEAQIDAMGASGGGRRRPKNDMNLVEALSKALDGKTMSVTEVAEAVQRHREQLPHAEVHVYPAGHGFHCDQRADFDAASAALAWRRTLNTLFCRVWML